MPRISVHDEFRFSPDGREVVTYGPGEHEVTELCAGYACAKAKATRMGNPAVPSAPPQPEVLVQTEAPAVPLAQPGAQKPAAKKPQPKAQAKAQPKAKPKS